MKKELTTKETELLRAKFWALQEAQRDLGDTLNEIALKHGCPIDKERWSVTSDFKALVKQ